MDFRLAKDWMVWLFILFSSSVFGKLGIFSPRYGDSAAGNSHQLRGNTSLWHFLLLVTAEEAMRGLSFLSLASVLLFSAVPAGRWSATGYFSSAEFLSPISAPRMIVLICQITEKHLSMLFSDSCFYRDLRRAPQGFLQSTWISTSGQGFCAENMVLH